MTPNDYIHAARCPDDMPMGIFGPWTINRRYAADALERAALGFGHQTRLQRSAWGCLNCHPTETVMEDSILELSRHLPIWLAASGRVLVTGLGLGCVMRGLLANPNVNHIDCVEIDAHIVEIVGREFNRNERVTIYHADALSCEWEPDKRWEYAWHDLWVEKGSLHELHSTLILRNKERCLHQGAWSLPRIFKRVLRDHNVVSVIG